MRQAVRTVRNFPEGDSLMETGLQAIRIINIFSGEILIFKGPCDTVK